MKQYDVYSYYGNCIGQVWAANASDALAIARAEYDSDVYVLAVKTNSEAERAE